jgi:molybdopterin-binding protein
VVIEPPVGPVAIRCRTGSPLLAPTRNEYSIFSLLSQESRADTESRFTWTCTRCGDIIPPMKLSARNHLVGKVEEVKLGNVMAHVVVRVGENIIESVITRRSAEEMGLKLGDTVAAIIKSTEVMLQKD